jgi:dipeptidase D
MSVLENLEPKMVFRFFEELCAIPHGSRNTRGVSDYCVRFAADRNLRSHQDRANNVILFKNASPGYESAAPVILQGHLDMVCETDAGCGKNLAADGLDLGIDGDLVYAKGTSLGGDDGIAVAIALAILDDNSIPHPPLEVVFTTDEEIGMLGAEALDPSLLKGRRMLNLDSEAEGIFTVGCAGGSLDTCSLPLRRAPFAGDALTVTVGGLIGGHSGAEIGKGRGNSNLLMGRVLDAFRRRAELRLVCADGGGKDNAIPRETTARIVTGDAAAIRAAAAELDAALKHEYQTSDPGVFVRAEPCAAGAVPLDQASTARAVCLLCCAPNGVQDMSADIPGLVQTSLNLGILRTEETRMTAAFCVRSSVATRKRMLTDRLTCLTEQLGGSVTVSGDYPGWEYQKDSALRALMTEVFREQYGHDPKVETIHAGVECGWFSKKLPGLDCVSYGPDLTEIHTPRERMSVSSVQRVWKFTLEVLKRCR